MTHGLAIAYSALCIILERANQWSGGARSLFVLEHKWGTITSKGARWYGSQHWGACTRRTAFGRAEVRGGVAPPEKGVRACNPRNFLKICFLYPAFSCHERQKVGLCWCEKLL